MKKIFGGVLLTIALAAPFAMQAQDHDQRYYDSAHKDYHQWGPGEDSAYHQWLKENHRKDHEWAHATKKEQQAYWNWRHDHPDHH